MQFIALAATILVLPRISHCEFITLEPEAATTIFTNGLNYGPTPVPLFGGGLSQPPVDRAPVIQAFVAAALQPNATGSARPSIQVGRNSSEAVSFEVDSPPLYNWMLNVTNISLTDTQSIVGGALELVLPQSEVQRLSDENKTLEYHLLYTNRRADNASQADDGSCEALLGRTCLTELLVDFLDNTKTKVEDFPVDCLNFAGSDISSDPASVNASAVLFDTSIMPSSPGVTPDGLYNTENNYDNPELRFLDFNGTASRASINHVFYGNSTAAYFQALTQLLPIIVVERFQNRTDALNGTEIASFSCIRARDVAPGSLALPADYWQRPAGPLNASWNVNDSTPPGADDKSTAASNQASWTVAMLAVMVAVLTQVYL